MRQMKQCPNTDLKHIRVTNTKENKKDNKIYYTGSI